MLHEFGTKIVLKQADDFDKTQYQGLSPLQDGDDGTVMEDCVAAPFVYWTRTGEIRCVLTNQLTPLEQ